MTCLKGKYKIKNVNKYRGNHDNIIFRSSWELKVFRFLDQNSNVLWWSSEELSIPYISPIDNNIHKYYPDIFFQVKQKNGNIVTHLFEIKPYKQTIRPEQKRKTKKFLQEAATYAVNQEKWKAAELFCLQNGFKFSVVTEKDIKF